MTPLAAALRDQAVHCADLGSPFMAQLCAVLADRLAPGTPLADRLFGWPGDVTPRGAALPLRLASALHALVLRGDALAACYPPHRVDDGTLWHAVEQAMTTQAAFIDRWIDSPPQTNEVRRSAALIAAAHWLVARHALPLRLSELGASAGLNLMWDHFALDAGGVTLGPAAAALTLRPAWTGAAPPHRRHPQVVERRGVDLNPLDPASATDRERLRAYLWADQPDRITLTDAAIGVATATVERADAIDWLGPRLTHVPGQMHMVFHTIAWQYFPPEAQARGTALIEEAGRSATLRAPLAWVGMEGDGMTPGAALTVRLWPGDIRARLGRIDYHGRWVNWRPRML
ncbi:MAG: DUF2332 domain-containing protein [Rhodobacterales bacterium]|nr:DUF2332 domain-containing protein [Rhodobacterales bacterium]